MAFKQLLREKGITQTELAGVLSIHKSSISKWLSGETKPSPRNQRIMAKHLNVDPAQLEVYFGPNESLVTIDDILAHAGIASNVEQHENEYARAFTLELPYVPIEARAGFAQTFSASPSYSLASFDTYMLSFVNDPGTKYTATTTAVFEVNGDSMEETLPHGAKVIARLVPREKWGNVRERVVIVSFADYLVIKRVRGNNLTTRNELLLHSDTKRDVSPYPVALADIHSLWLVEEFADRPLIR